MNIQSALAQRSAASLDNLEVVQVFEKRSNKSPAFLRVKDGTGDTALKIWGPASNTAFSQGMVISIVASGARSSINAEADQQGREFFNVNDCDVTIISEGNPAQAAQPQRQAGGFQRGNFQRGGAARAPQDNTGTTPKDGQIIRQNALSHATAIVVAKGVNGTTDQAQAEIIRLAKVFAHYSQTGEDLSEDHIPI